MEEGKSKQLPEQSARCVYIACVYSCVLRFKLSAARVAEIAARY